MEIIFLRNNNTTRPAKKVPKIKCSFKLFNKLEIYIESSDTTSSLTWWKGINDFARNLTLLFQLLLGCAFAILETPILMASSPFLLRISFHSNTQQISQQYHLTLDYLYFFVELEYFLAHLWSVSKSKLTNNSDLLLL